MEEDKQAAAMMEAMCSVTGDILANLRSLDDEEYAALEQLFEESMKPLPSQSGDSKEKA